MPSSLEEIERSFDVAVDKAKRAGNIEVVNQLKAEKVDAITKYRMEALVERERKLWQREALRDFPLAAEFPDMVTGNTEDEVRGAAQRLHERIDKAFATFQRQRRVNKLVEEALASEETGESSEEAAGDAAAN